ncbi:hypothetical protein DPMN_132151 [Dreissena polymorpha]|uniref:Uncharacterized protein n=1 Tax=Dreissena polymorpha TaxID=45954 RepID=A0A9D4FTA6_DREPO|nr:hypothetical protein DPMN_132151 [Dreissena polymorpha]
MAHLALYIARLTINVTTNAKRRKTYCRIDALAVLMSQNCTAAICPNNNETRNM